MSLRRLPHASLVASPGWFSVGLRLDIPPRWVELKAVSKTDFLFNEGLQKEWPVPVCRVLGDRYWKFQDEIYWENEGLEPNEVHALITSEKLRRRAQIQRAQQVTAMAARTPYEHSRTRIPEDIKHVVWLRDKGMCLRCGSKSDLQFDHMIPVVHGGSNSPQNIQILCGTCNREKGTKISYN